MSNRKTSSPSHAALLGYLFAGAAIWTAVVIDLVAGPASPDPRPPCAAQALNLASATSTR
jgi:hypothetical protein